MLGQKATAPALEAVLFCTFALHLALIASGLTAFLLAPPSSTSLQLGPKLVSAH